MIAIIKSNYQLMIQPARIFIIILEINHTKNIVVNNAFGASVQYDGVLPVQ